MRIMAASCAVTRTTVDIDPQVLRELKRRQERDGKSLGRLVSELLVAAMAKEEPAPATRPAWTTAPMRARIDLEDKEALRRSLGDE